MRKASEMTADMIRACVVKCTIKIPHGKNNNHVVTADSGDYFAYPAKSEVMRKFRKMANEDLRMRKLKLKTNTNDYHGDFGRVRIGGKMFSLFPYSGMLVRDDFAMWAEKHFDECWDSVRHCERIVDKDTSGVAVPEGTIKDDFAYARKLAMKMGNVTDLLEPGSYNSLHEMKASMAEYMLAVNAANERGKFFIGTHLLSNMLAATIAFREKKFADAVKFALAIAALGLKMADFFKSEAERIKNESGK